MRGAEREEEGERERGRWKENKRRESRREMEIKRGREKEEERARVMGILATERAIVCSEEEIMPRAPSGRGSLCGLRAGDEAKGQTAPLLRAHGQI